MKARCEVDEWLLRLDFLAAISCAREHLNGRVTALRTGFILYTRGVAGVFWSDQLGIGMAYIVGGWSFSDILDV